MGVFAVEWVVPMIWMGNTGSKGALSLTSAEFHTTVSQVQRLAIGTYWMPIVKKKQYIYFIFKILKDFIYLFIFRERRRKGEREGQKHHCVVAFHVPSTGDLAQNPVMCPDWKSNLWPFGLQAITQSTEPHQPGLTRIFKICLPY